MPEDATPLVELVNLPAPPDVIQIVETVDDTNCDPKQARCLWVMPRVPKPGEMVMFETTAERWAQAALLTVFGRDVRMFRVGDRFRAYAGVPLGGPPTPSPTRLWLASSSEPEGRAFQCFDTPVSPRVTDNAESLRVARRFLHGSGGSAEQNTAWVQPLDAGPFSLSLFTWPRTGELNSRFMVGRVFNKRMQTRHMGVDIQGAVGDRVFATQAGVVRFAGKLKDTGQTLVLDHGGGVLSFYMHLSQRLKKRDQRVQQGEVIGHVGRTGRVTGPHLHFAMSVHGRFVDPEQVLAHPLYADESGAVCKLEQSFVSAR